MRHPLCALANIFNKKRLHKLRYLNGIYLCGRCGYSTPFKDWWQQLIQKVPTKSKA